MCIRDSPVIAYPKYAFTDSSASQAQKDGLDDWMVTVDEYNKILNNLYERGYILVRMEDVWTETSDGTGVPHMVRNTLMLPEGKMCIRDRYWAPSWLRRALCCICSCAAGANASWGRSSWGWAFSLSA